MTLEAQFVLAFLVVDLMAASWLLRFILRRWPH